MKRHNPDTREVYDTDSVWIGYYQNAIEDKEYWKLPIYIKYQGRVFIIDVNDDCYIDSCGICIPIYHIGWMMNNEEAEPFDININRIGKKEDTLSLLELFHKNGNAILEDEKQYWSEETKKLYNIKGETMENYKLESVYISKIENGFIITASMSKLVKDRDKWEDFKTYCETLDQVKIKLEEIYK